MANKVVVGWFTMNGNHIPIYKGESKEDAVKRSLRDKEADDFLKNYIAKTGGSKSVSDSDMKSKVYSSGYRPAVDSLVKKGMSQKEAIKTVYEDKIIRHSHPSVAQKNEDIKAEQIAKNKAEADKLNGKSEHQLPDKVKKSFDDMSDKELDHYSKAYVKNVKTLSEKIDKSTDPKEKAWLSEHLEKIKAEQDYINSKKSGSKEKSNVLFKFDWDKLPGSATAHGEMVKYLKKNKIDWFNTPHFDLVADVDRDGNYYKLDHKGNGVVGIDRSKAYKKKGFGTK